ncbi:hypothetical protein EVAR_92332_1 [Eumeta japonica]|uniref:Uncharacterized protein n=1 Tax=Eumeta variegata TaxID=151549 RepID=A0A4C1TIK1_EUMVA|nr:hypothetical protein EVAR_92332_1 [Eumeta japonica]
MQISASTFTPSRLNLLEYSGSAIFTPEERNEGYKDLVSGPYKIDSVSSPVPLSVNSIIVPQRGVRSSADFPSRQILEFARKPRKQIRALSRGAVARILIFIAIPPKPSLLRSLSRLGKLGHLMKRLSGQFRWSHNPHISPSSCAGST